MQVLYRGFGIFFKGSLSTQVCNMGLMAGISQTFTPCVRVLDRAIPEVEKALLLYPEPPQASKVTHPLQALNHIILSKQDANSSGWVLGSHE